MKTKEMVFVPHWVESVLRRNRHDLASVTDYTKVRGLMSEQDMGAFLSLQRPDKIGIFKSAYYGHLLSSWGQNRSTDEKTELDSVVVPQSYSKDVIDDTWARLCADPNSGDPERECAWRLVDCSKDEFALVMYPGFVEEMQTPAQQLKLLQAILNVFYGYLQVHEVSALPIFRSYVGLLQAAS